MTPTPIRRHAEQYLAMRRGLGFTLTTFGQKLFSFIDYLEAHDLNTITTEAALDWAMSTPRSSDQVHWSRRMMVARIFARHMAVLNPATEIPPADILPHHYRRITPHLYAPEQVTALLDAADGLRPPLRALTWHTLICLLAVTGMRTSEACRLDRADIDLHQGVLTIRDSKYGKTRQLPIHASTTTALRGYLRERNRLTGVTATPAVFITTHGTRLDHHNIPHTFARLLTTAGITTPAGRRRPRLHDLRHSFAVATLLDWHRDGGNVQARLPLLSTYLGHVDPKATWLRVSELISLTIADISLGAGPHVRCTGKGRKNRATPLTRPAARALRAWLTERTNARGDEPVFITCRGSALSRDAVTHLVARHTATAARTCPTLATKTVTPHTLRHSTAMALLARVSDDLAVSWVGRSVV